MCVCVCSWMLNIFSVIFIYIYFFFLSYLSLVQRFIPLSLSMVMLKRHCVANVNVADCLFSLYDFSISNLIYDAHSMENTPFPSPNVNARQEGKKNMAFTSKKV